MSLHIIIDGYNLIRQTPELAELDRLDLELGRDALIERLSAYKRIKPNRITVVFDGTQALAVGPYQEKRSGISILYSQAGEIADGVIKRMADRERERAVVVSSDRDVAHHAERAGCAVLRSEDFARKLTHACWYGNGSDASEIAEETGGWRPTTRKKGPSRKLPRKQRKNRLRIDQL
uniref:NYN domain-containing protein n=1 Tax=Desulfatirhabdium butyrativorans TaxID=340467 RepID=A0A7C4MQ12_9BACT